MKPNFSEEKKLWKKGFKQVIGLDEAGRGPLAGPVVAGAVFLNFKTNADFKILTGVNDSKKLSEKQREYFYQILTCHPQIEWGVGIVSGKTIDRINILEATKLAMKKAVVELFRKLSGRKVCRRDCFLILDGNFKLKTDISQKSIIKADQKVFSCAAASIIAKVSRDRIMLKYHKKYPVYGFASHKGYGTKTHIKNLRKFGCCNIHRKTFYPASLNFLKIKLK